MDEIGAGQWGLVSHSQLLELVSQRQVGTLRAAGALVVVHNGVYRLAGAPPSWRQRALACCLAYGTPVAISHLAAARLWEIEGIATDEPVVTLPPGRSGRRPGIVTHRAPLSDDEVTARYGIPVTTMPRTLLDLAGVISPYLLERAIDQAQRQHLAAPAELVALLESRSGSGRKGNATLRRLLELRIAHPGVGDDAWVDRAWGWIVDAGIEAPKRQVPVVVNGVQRILDMAYVEDLVAVEFAGFDFHGRRHRYDADAVRTTDLGLAGWLVVTVTSRQCRDEVVDRVRRALAIRRGSAAARPGTGPHHP